MGIRNTLLRAVTWWHGETLNTQFYTWRKGVLVGEDAQGNRYYRTRDDKHRWVIYNGEVEPSRIPPEWHGWLHHTFEKPPTEAPLVHRPWERPHKPNLTGTSQSYHPPGSLHAASPARRQDYEAWQPE